MNSRLLLPIVLTLLSLVNAAAADKSVLVRACIYAVPKKAALALMDAPAFTSDPQASIHALRGMVAEKKASVASNLCVSALLGTRTNIQSDFMLQFEVTEAEGGAIKLVAALEKRMKAPTPQILATLTLKRGDTQFLGSCDDPSSDPNAPTWIVFVTLQ